MSVTYTMHARRIFLATLTVRGCTALCYFRNGDLAQINGQGYQQCPGSSFCCLPTDACVDNGLCRDNNNHEDGSVVYYDGGEHNETGLYQTPACSNSDYAGLCSEQCTNGTLLTTSRNLTVRLTLPSILQHPRVHMGL